MTHDRYETEFSGQEFAHTIDRVCRLLSNAREEFIWSACKWERRMLGLFGGKDWNVVAVIFVRRDLYQISGQRAKGGEATKARDGAKGHPRSIYWAVFDQKGSYLEGGHGAGSLQTTKDALKRLEKELATNRTVQEVLKILETKQSDKAAKPLAWAGYPPRDLYGLDTQEGAT